MASRYLVLGSGMQGTACGYYFAKYGEADSICMADISPEVAQKSADRINQLCSSDIATSASVDAKDHSSLVKLFKDYDGVLSAIDYRLNVQITQAAIEAGVHLCDLGGNTDVVRKQLELSKKAEDKNISIIPDCGLAPGLGNTLASYGIGLLDECETVEVRCGGLAQEPKGPLGYKLVFAISGLTNEYFGKAWALRDSKVVQIDTFTELEELEFDAPVGQCEAFVTTGGTSTAPWTFKDRVKTYDYKTVRYPGHFEKFKVMMDLGLLDLEPVDVQGQKVVPREVFHSVVAPKLDYPEDKDLVVLRATCSGKKDAAEKKVQFDLMLFQDDETGFTAMEMGTGYPAALCLIHCVRGQAKKGVVSLEIALDNAKYVEELISNGMPIKRS